jgi:hypothetical protein
MLEKYLSTPARDPPVLTVLHIKRHDPAYQPYCLLLSGRQPAQHCQLQYKRPLLTELMAGALSAHCCSQRGNLITAFTLVDMAPAVIISKVGCLTTLSMSRMSSVDDRIINECGAVGGMRIGKRNRSSRRRRFSVSLCPPQILHDLA